MWWTQEELRLMREEAHDEIKLVMATHQLSRKEAVSCLYEDISMPYERDHI
jgi:hypothetical protein